MPEHELHVFLADVPDLLAALDGITELRLLFDWIDLDQPDTHATIKVVTWYSRPTAAGHLDLSVMVHVRSVMVGTVQYDLTENGARRLSETADQLAARVNEYLLARTYDLRIDFVSSR